MTEPEIEALSVRLARVWNLPDPITRNKDYPAHLRLRARVEPLVELLCVGNRDSPYAEFTIYLTCYDQPPSRKITGSMECDIRNGEIDTSAPHRPRNDIATIESYARFEHDWLPFFRRGCWLSGFPIEASAHEKAEWIRDFTREEVESWNLKM